MSLVQVRAAGLRARGRWDSFVAGAGEAGLSRRARDTRGLLRVRWMLADSFALKPDAFLAAVAKPLVACCGAEPGQGTCNLRSRACGSHVRCYFFVCLAGRCGFLSLALHPVALYSRKEAVRCARFAGENNSCTRAMVQNFGTAPCD